MCGVGVCVFVRECGSVRAHLCVWVCCVFVSECRLVCVCVCVCLCLCRRVYVCVFCERVLVL